LPEEGEPRYQYRSHERLDREEGKGEWKWAIGQGGGERVTESLRQGELDLGFLAGGIWVFSFFNNSCKIEV